MIVFRLEFTKIRSGFENSVDFRPYPEVINGKVCFQLL